MAKKYPETHISRCTHNRRPFLEHKQCDRCGNFLDKEEDAVVLDVQVSWFRGEDEVYAFHDECWEVHKKDLRDRGKYGETYGKVYGS